MVGKSRAVDARTPGTRSGLAWPRLLPPARLLWISLAVLGIYGIQALYGLGVVSLLALPAIAAVSDLAFQAARFPRLRFPDAALATGLFLALILPPVVPLALAGAATFSGIAIRHALRHRGHPFLNPAVSGVVIVGVVFGLAPAWWVSVGPLEPYLLVGLGLLLLARTPRAWRIPVGFFVTYGLVITAVHLLVGAAVDPKLVLLGVLDPALLFFGLYMVSEPRTAPSDPFFQPIYGGGAGAGAALLTLFLPSLGVLVGLLLVNLVVGLSRLGVSIRDAEPAGGRARSGSSRRRRERPSRWPVAYRASAGFFVLVVLLVAAALSPIAHPQPVVIIGPGGGGGGAGSGGGGGGALTNCSHDNPSIPATTLTSLHQILGPSVILYDYPSTGVVVFFDPVNHVTVTESDLYEDFGYAEFNGDDYAVSGCHP